MECPDARISLGVYVLGAIDPADRALVDAHLATCRECRDELAGLAGLPALLARVSKEEAIGLADTNGDTDGDADGDAKDPSPLRAVEPPPELLTTVLDLTAARRRRRRWRDASIAAAAAAIAAVGVLGALQLGSSPAQNLSYGPQIGQPETVTGQSGSMTATVTYTLMGWGTQFDTKVTGIPSGTNCQLMVIEKDGKHVVVSNWVTDENEGSIGYPGSSALTTADIASFEVTVGTRQSIPIQA